MEHLLTPRLYTVVFVILAALTILTVGLAFVPATPMMRIFTGQAIAIVKASLVVLFFMHALRSPAQTWAVIIVSVFWFVGVLMSLTLTDYFTRGLIPGMPGH